MKRNTSNRQEVGEIKKFFFRVYFNTPPHTHFWQGYLVLNKLRVNEQF